MNLNKEYWENRYLNYNIGWDIGCVSTPIKAYINQLTNKDIKILIPGTGNGYEAEYLFNNGFKNVYVIDIAKQPLVNFKKRVPNFPNNQLLQGDFFKINQKFDLVIEQTFFCALNPILRTNYIDKTHNVLNKNGKIVGLLFQFPLTKDGPPFGGSIEEYIKRFTAKFKIKTLENCYNSIKPRNGKELFVLLIKK